MGPFMSDAGKGAIVLHVSFAVRLINLVGIRFATELSTTNITETELLGLLVSCFLIPKPVNLQAYVNKQGPDKGKKTLKPQHFNITCTPNFNRFVAIARCLKDIK